MSSLKRCPKCKQYKFDTDECQCHLYLCWYSGDIDSNTMEPDPEEIKEIHAHSSEDAAIAMSKLANEDDPTDHIYIIFVMDSTSDEGRIYEVKPEIEINYIAYEVQL